MVSRPAVVLTPRPIGPDGLLLWAAMITNASRAEWPDDVHIDDAEAIGLVIPSKVRTAKIAAVEARSATRIGRLDAALWNAVRERVGRHLGLGKCACANRRKRLRA